MDFKKAYSDYLSKSESPDNINSIDDIAKFTCKLHPMEEEQLEVFTLIINETIKDGGNLVSTRLEENAHKSGDQVADLLCDILKEVLIRGVVTATINVSSFFAALRDINEEPN